MNKIKDNVINFNAIYNVITLLKYFDASTKS